MQKQCVEIEILGVNPKQKWLKFQSHNQTMTAFYLEEIETLTKGTHCQATLVIEAQEIFLSEYPHPLSLKNTESHWVEFDGRIESLSKMDQHTEIHWNYQGIPITLKVTISNKHVSVGDFISGKGQLKLVEIASC